MKLLKIIKKKRKIGNEFFFRKLTLNDAMVKMYHDVLCTYIMNQKSANKLNMLLDNK